MDQKEGKVLQIAAVYCHVQCKWMQRNGKHEVMFDWIVPRCLVSDCNLVTSPSRSSGVWCMSCSAMQSMSTRFVPCMSLARHVSVVLPIARSANQLLECWEEPSAEAILRRETMLVRSICTCQQYPKTSITLYYNYYIL